jgi:hypothetical protein
MFSAQLTMLWYRSKNWLEGLNLNIYFNTRECFRLAEFWPALYNDLNASFAFLSLMTAFRSHMHTLRTLCHPRALTPLASLFPISDWVVLIAENKDWHEPQIDRLWFHVKCCPCSPSGIINMLPLHWPATKEAYTVASCVPNEFVLPFMLSTLETGSPFLTSNCIRVCYIQKSLSLLALVTQIHAFHFVGLWC